MGWLISIVMLFIASIHGNDTLMVTSGLFAIAGAIAELSGAVKSIKSLIEKKPNKSTDNDLSFLE
jgi:hypothetical protein